MGLDHTLSLTALISAYRARLIPPDMPSLIVSLVWPVFSRLLAGHLLPCRLWHFFNLENHQQNTQQILQLWRGLTSLRGWYQTWRCGESMIRQWGDWDKSMFWRIFARTWLSLDHSQSPVNPLVYYWVFGFLKVALTRVTKKGSGIIVTCNGTSRLNTPWIWSSAWMKFQSVEDYVTFARSYLREYYFWALRPHRCTSAHK